MSNELERRLEGLLAEAPEPEAGAGEEALHRALQAVRAVAAPRRGVRAAALAFAAAAVLLAVAAGSLAAAGALHVSFGAKKKQRPAITTQLALPQGANGIAAIVNGRLSVVTKGGFRLQGLQASAATLSPHALFVAAGIGRSLVAIAPDGRRPWSQPAGGRVVAIAWAPEGNRIAYIVRAGPRLVLHVIWGNGTHDAVIDRGVRAVRPSWRGDSLAFAYVGGGGRAIVYDLGHQSRQVVAVSPPVTGVAFAPTGASLAVSTTGGVKLVDRNGARPVASGTLEAFGWLKGRLAVAVPGLDSALIQSFAPSGASRGSYHVHGIVVAVTPKFVVVRSVQKLLAGHTTLLTTPRGATVRDLALG